MSSGGIFENLGYRVRLDSAHGGVQKARGSSLTGNLDTKVPPYVLHSVRGVKFFSKVEK